MPVSASGENATRSSSARRSSSSVAGTGSTREPAAAVAGRSAQGNESSSRRSCSASVATRASGLGAARVEFAVRPGVCEADLRVSTSLPAASRGEAALFVVVVAVAGEAAERAAVVAAGVAPVPASPVEAAGGVVAEVSGSTRSMRVRTALCPPCSKRLALSASTATATKPKPSCVPTPRLTRAPAWSRGGAAEGGSAACATGIGFRRMKVL